jgi:hypothetical protein
MLSAGTPLSVELLHQFSGYQPDRRTDLEKYLAMAGLAARVRLQ